VEPISQNTACALAPAVQPLSRGHRPDGASRNNIEKRRGSELLTRNIEQLGVRLE
jgi:hypothetical protein